MKVLKQLTLPIGSDNVTVDFGVLNTRTEVQSSYTLRYKIYSKYNYLLHPESHNGYECDEYDELENCIYFAGVVGERQIAGVRLINSHKLPIHSAFQFATPKGHDGVDILIQSEIGRLVVDRYSDSAHTPRNILLLMLAAVMAEHCTKVGIQYSYAFLKERLIKKLTRLGLPFTKIEPYRLTYPRGGPMEPYFYDKTDLASPAYLELAAVQSFLTSTIESEMLFQRLGDNHLLLKTNLYSRFLRTIGVI